MAAEEHTFHVGDTFSSLEELERRIQLFQQHHDIQLYKRRTRTIENTIKRSAKQAKRAFNPAIKFVEVELHCIHGGKKFKSVSTGARPHVKTFQLGCTFSVSLIAAEDGQTLIVHKMNDQHANHISRRIKEEVSHLKIGFIGAGNMAYGIAQGILQPGDVIASNVIVSAPSKNNFSRFQAMGVTVTHSNQEVVQNSQLVFLAVKPHLIPTVLSALSEHVTSEHIIVSMAAGVTLATLEELLPGGSCVMRVMPNLPCMLQEGALLLACGTVVKEDMVACLKNLLSSCGLVEVGPESWIDAHTGLSGSGVAFVYVFAEALAEGAVKMGMPSALAQRLAAQTILGAGRLLRDGNKHPAQLKADVCTPGGTTVYGLHALEKGGLRATVIGAVEAATERARELGRK